MKVYEIPIKKLSPSGTVIHIESKVVPMIDKMALFIFWHNENLIGTILCEVGDLRIFEATDFLIDGYFQSEEFESFIREGEYGTE